MISKIAVHAWLNRELRNHEWMKKLTDAELDERILKLRVPAHFDTKPWRHQKVGFLIGVKRAAFMFYYDMGMGKSSLTLNIIKYRMFADNVKRALVVVPNVVNLEGWRREIKVHTPSLRCTEIYGDLSTRLRLLETNAHIDLINYDGLPVLLTEKRKVERIVRGRKKVVTDPHFIVNEKVSEFAQRYDLVVFDETQRFRSWKSLTYKLCRQLAHQIKYRYGLTGTPFGRDPQALWPQFQVIDKGETLGNTLGIFRGALFEEKENYWSGYPDYVLPKKNRKILRKIIQNRSIRYREGAGDMPTVVPIIKPLKIPQETMSYYRTLKEELKKARGNKQIVEAVFMRMRMLSSGFLSMKQDETKIEAEFGNNPKLEALLELIDELPENRKMVVFHEFIYSGQRIAKELRALKIPVLQIYGEVSAKDKIANLAKFLDDPKYCILLINSASGGSGLNLQVANYEVFYESPIDPITRQQCERRLIRRGQTRTVYQYDFVMEGAPDEKILKWLQQGKNLLEDILDGKVLEAW